MKPHIVSSWALCLALFVSGCSLGAPAPTPVPLTPTLPLPQIFTTQLPQEPTPTIAPTSTESPTPEPVIDIVKGAAEFGVEIYSFNVDYGKIKSLGARWIRYNGIIWSELEPAEGQIDWGKAAAFEEGARKASEAGLKLMVAVRGVPDWAQKFYGYSCGQIQTEKLGSFGDFLSQLVARYSQAPFNVHAWELWNEPDVSPELVPGNSPFGCWGDRTDWYYGGGAFTEMLRVVVPMMRAADPGVKILPGGLLLDCDPTLAGEPGRCGVGYDLPPRFIEGILRTGGGEFLDFLNFHGYPSFDPNMYSPANSEINFPTWQARGGVVAGKANYLSDMMAANHVNLPLFLTETSYLCPESYSLCNPVDPDFFQKQAQYGSWLVVRNYAENINTIWYTFEGPGWRNGALLDKDQNPRPVYFAVQYALSRISVSAITRKVDEYPGISGYEFQSQQGRFLFLAPTEATPPDWTPPENISAVTDIFGQAVSLDSVSPLTAPIFVDLP